MTPVRVLIVDDSALVRQMLREILAADPAIEVVGYAADANAARDKIRALEPDVLTLDVEMPGMNGISFLRRLMRLHPIPVVMVSSLTEDGAAVTLDALAAGAVDFVAKPRVDIAGTLGDYAEEITSKVKAAARARVPDVEPVSANRPPLAEAPRRARSEAVDVIAIGASAGGVEAIRRLLEPLPDTLPAILVTQHIPGGFSRAFAERLHRCTAVAVTEAHDGQPVAPGHAYVAPGGKHLELVRREDGLVCAVGEGPRVNQHRPSVDVLFRSAARAVGGRAVGVLLTGMGADGARGLAALHRAGACTIAQDEASSVIWGMPREAILLGCVDHVLPLDEIPPFLSALREKLATR